MNLKDFAALVASQINSIQPDDSTSPIQTSVLQEKERQALTALLSTGITFQKLCTPSDSVALENPWLLT
jgi:hypothetical protein